MKKLRKIPIPYLETLALITLAVAAQLYG